ncbi:Signal peptidase complex subunit 2 [Purpureocillium lavendulum]|uniref:Signal peptidase complex subunit 2 n=1 Tax=Purpureocillium lavendulum TaxID=1247861 RepID=A0AB34G126_9HYPO|nr:Signal peptidase complex subunit 2 [Purpureocillium lavendulum]
MRTKISDLVQVHPEDFSKHSIVALEDNINAKYANKVIQKIGLCICLYDILWTSEGLIGHGSGLVNVNGMQLTAFVRPLQLCVSLANAAAVEFRMVVFRPFKGETMLGKIRSSTPAGINVRTDFFDDIFVPYEELPEGAEYNHGEQLWIWNLEDSRLFYDNHEMVRFQVIDEEWHDQTPAGPSQGDDAPAKSPYKIKGSMTLLDIVQDGIVLDDSQVLGLGLELLVRVLAGAAHAAHGHLLRGHLLGHLAGGYGWSVYWRGQKLDALITYPLKKALIQLMMSVLGMIMAMLFFIMPIMPSIWLGRLALAIRLLEERARLVARGEGLAAGLKGALRQGVVVGAEGDAAGQGALLPQGPGFELLGRRGHEDGRVVAQHAGEDHDDGDGDEDPGLDGDLRHGEGVEGRWPGARSRRMAVEGGGGNVDAPVATVLDGWMMVVVVVVEEDCARGRSLDSAASRIPLTPSSNPLSNAHTAARARNTPAIMATEKISLYNLADLKNTSDDAIPNYLNSLKFKQSHFLTDVRLALGYTGFALAAACFLWDYKLGFESTKTYTAVAVAVYTLINGALTFWMSEVEKGTVYQGFAPSGDKASPGPPFPPDHRRPENSQMGVSIKSTAKKNDPTYRLVITVESKNSSAPEVVELAKPFATFFDETGRFVAQPFQEALASAVPAIGRLDPKRVKLASQAMLDANPDLLDAVMAANAAQADGSQAGAATGAEAAEKKGGKRRKA